MNPNDNPLAARLLVSPRGVVTIPEDDPKWKIICDMYAPDTKDSFKGNELSETYGAAFEKRLDALQEQKKTFGKVQTYGKSQEELDGLWNTKTKVNDGKAPVAKEKADKNAMRADFATVLSGKPKEASQPKQAGMTMPPPMPTKGKVVPPPLNGVQMPLAPAGAMPPMPKQAESTMPPPPPPTRSLQDKLNQMSHKPNLMQTLQSRTVQNATAPKIPVKQAVRQGESR